MYITLTNAQRGGAVELQRPIDNRRGDMQIGLRSICYTVGWHNIHEGESVVWTGVSPSGEYITKTTQIPPGLYGLANFKSILGPLATISADPATGVATLSVSGNAQIRISSGVFPLLGLTNGDEGLWLPPGSSYTGSRPVDLSPVKALYIHLEQLNTSENVLDGAPSTLLAVVGLGRHSFGDTNTVRAARPEFRRLARGTINELKIFVKDDSGRSIDNHGLPISLTLEYEHIRTT